MNDLERFLKTPRGLAWLFSLTLVGAIGLAVVMATQRDFFEKYAREKFEASPIEAQSFADEIRQGTKPLNSLKERVVPQLDALYSIYIEHAGTNDARIAEALVHSAPDRVLARLERTFAAGNMAQRMRAAQLVEAAPRRLFVAVLEKSLVDARAKRLSELTTRLEVALGKCRAAE